MVTLKICKIILDVVDDENPMTGNLTSLLYRTANKGHFEVFKFIFEKVSTNNSKKNDEFNPQ